MALHMLPILALLLNCFLSPLRVFNPTFGQPSRQIPIRKPKPL
jgi:hypothetical protein